MGKRKIAIAYMVAGLSSRFEGRIKQFAKVGPSGEMLIEYSMNQAIKSGFNRCVFIVGELTEKPFKEKFGNSYKGIPVEYALQKFDKKERDRPWGTLEAVSLLKGIVNFPFVVCNGDDIYGKNAFKTLFNHLQKYDAAATVSYKLIDVLPEKGKTNRGVFQIKDGKVIDIIEVLNIDRENLIATNSKEDDTISMNIFALHAEDLERIEQVVNKFKERRKGDRKIECFLSQELGNLIKRNELVMAVYPANSRWFGITNPDDEVVVREKLQQIKRLLKNSGNFQNVKNL